MDSHLENAGIQMSTSFDNFFEAREPSGEKLVVSLQHLERIFPLSKVFAPTLAQPAT